MRRRILVATLSVTIVTLLVFGVPLALALGRFYRSQELSRLQQAATVAAAAVPAEGLHGADPIEPPVVPPNVQLSYYDEHGLLAAGSGPGRADGVAQRALAGSPAEGPSGARVASAQPIVANEATIGTVEASSSRAALTWRTERAWLEMLVLGAVALGTAALIALGQARRLARPVDDLVGAAGRLGEGDFTVAASRSGIAEIDRAGEALASTSGRLRDMVARERAFTAHASHQLRTPLTALRLSLDNALITPGVDIEEAVRDAVDEVDRLEETLGQLFALARNGLEPPAGRSVPVAEVLGALERRWRPTLAERGRRFHVTGDALAGRPAPATLGQILDILVDNAATHGQGTVEVAARAVPGGMCIDVQDEGEGMTASVPGPGGDGHGLGLGLARALAEAAGGRLVLRRPGPLPIVAVILP